MTKSSDIGDQLKPVDRPDRSSPAIRQLAAYDISLAELNDDTKPNVSVPKGLFKDLIRLALEQVTVDDDWYRSKYPDVYAQELHGNFRSPKDHYIRFGFFENRLPHPISVDQEFYLKVYPDMMKIAASSLSALQAHFENYGFKEGRIPRKNWVLTSPES